VTSPLRQEADRLALLAASLRHYLDDPYAVQLAPERKAELEDTLTWTEERASSLKDLVARLEAPLKGAPAYSGTWKRCETERTIKLYRHDGSVFRVIPEDEEPVP
jgi:hypothetical protein